MSYISTNLNMLTATVKKVSGGLARDFNELEKLQTSIKGHAEFTKAAIERTLKKLRAELQKSRPQMPVVTKGEKLPQGSYFLVSALDGELNFVHGIPHFAVTIAEITDSQVVSGVIYNPATSDMYFAEKGNGAFKEGYRNHERMRVSARKDLPMALISADDAYASNVAGVRKFGAISLDLADLAAGKLDGIISMSNDSASIAAGILLVKEAGGQIFAKEQKDIRTADLPLVLSSGNIVASNGELGKKLFDLIK